MPDLGWMKNYLPEEEKLDKFFKKAIKIKDALELPDVKLSEGLIVQKVKNLMDWFDSLQGTDLMQTDGWFHFYLILFSLQV